MHSNIDTTIDRFLAEVVERGIVADLEPLRIRIMGVERRPATTEPKIVESVDLALRDCQEETVRSDDGICR